MKIYTVHRLPGTTATDVRSVRFIRDGFAWLGLAVPLLWLLFNRLWLATAIYVAVMICATIAAELAGIGEAMAFPLSLLSGLFIGLEGNKWHRAKLRRLGFIDDGVVGGASLEDAELAYFSRAAGLGAGGAPVQRFQTGNKAGKQAQPANANRVPGVGLFPEATS